MTISKYKKKSLFVFISVVVVVWVINFAFIQGAFLTSYVKVHNWWLVYLVLVPQFLLAYFFILKKAETPDKSQKIGYYFIATLTIRAILAICFLGPWLFFKDDTSRPMVGQFMFVFLSLLIAEISLLVSYLNQSVSETEKDA